MAPIDIAAYYREQDQCFNQFNEGVQEYIARRNLDLKPIIPPEDSHPIVTSDNTPADSRFAAENPEMKLPLRPKLKEAEPLRHKTARPLTALAVPADPTERSEVPLAPEPSMEIIEFTPPAKLERAAAYADPVVGRKNKRKPAIDLRSSPRKKAGPSLMNDSIEEISACELPKVRQVRPNSKGKPPVRIAKPLSRLQIPARKETSPQDQSLLSPIEDASGFAPSPIQKVSPAKRQPEAGNQKSGGLLERVQSAANAAKRKKQQQLVTRPDKGKGKVKAAQEADDVSSVIYLSSAPSSRSASPVPRKKQRTEKTATTSMAKKQSGSSTVAKPKPAKKPTKKTPILVLPKDHAEALMAQRAENPSKKHPWYQSLEGMTIYYYGFDYEYASEMTRNRMRLLVEHGATLVPKYDRDTVTHIICQDLKGGSRIPLLDALGLKKWDDIPAHVPTLHWSWVVPLLKNKEYVEPPEFWEHAAVSARIDVGVPKPIPNLRERLREQFKKKKPSATVEVPDSEDETDIKGAGALTSSSRSPHASSSKVPQAGPHAPAPEDPLAEFHDEAVAEHMKEWFRHSDDAANGNDTDFSEDEDEPVVIQRRPKGFACDRDGPIQDRCINQDIVDKLKELRDIYQAKPTDEDTWRVYSLNRVIRALTDYPKRIRTMKQALALDGSGKKTASKIMEIVETGGLRRIEYEMEGGDVTAAKLFLGIYGVGPKIAQRWIANGCRTLDDLTSGKGGVKISPVHEIGIRFYDDINSRMPRAEAKAIFDLIKPIALSIDPNLFVEIMGSYRRGKADCGDIDIMITRDPSDGRTHSGVLSLLLAKLRQKGILTEDLALPEDPDDLEAIYRGLCCLPDVPGSRRRRIDFLQIPWVNRGAALIYYTGDDVFNRSMRLKARKGGYSLNQRGLFKGVIRDSNNKSVKLNEGTLIASETEEEIFRILNVPFVPPEGRIRNPVAPSEKVK